MPRMFKRYSVDAQWVEGERIEGGARSNPGGRSQTGRIQVTVTVSPN